MQSRSIHCRVQDSRWEADGAVSGFASIVDQGSRSPSFSVTSSIVEGETPSILQYASFIHVEAWTFECAMVLIFSLGTRFNMSKRPRLMFTRSWMPIKFSLQLL